MNLEKQMPRRTISWSLGGTLPDWQGAPLAVVVLLEENDTTTTGIIGQTLLEAATKP